MKKKYILYSLILTLSLIGCALGVNMPDTSGCIRTCTAINKTCMNTEQACPAGDKCFNNLETCFNDANDYNHECSDCELKGTCIKEDDCRNTCGDQATECTNMIQSCVDLKEVCIKAEVSYKEECLNGPSGFMECVAVCIESVEQEIGKL